MRVAVILLREGLRKVLALVAIALVLGVGLGVGFTSLEIAHRTQRAYPDYLSREHVGQLVINASLSTEQAESVIRSVPGVEHVTSDSLLEVSGKSDLQDSVAAAFGQVRTSSDGRYATRDRPVVLEGRMVRSGAEAFVSRETASTLHLHVGAMIPLSFYEAVRGPPGAKPTGPNPPIGEATVRVVGIGVFSDEVLADELYPRLRVLLSHDVTAKYDCTLHTPRPDDTGSIGEVISAVVPPRCSMDYRYYSLQIAGGNAGANRVADELGRRFQVLNAHLPKALRDINVGYQIIPSFTADDAARVSESISPVVTALRVFGVAAGIATLAMTLLLVSRVFRRRARDVVVWRELGMARRSRALALLLPVGLTVCAGVLLALGTAWIASRIGAIASVRVVDPEPGRALSGIVLLAALAAVILLAVILPVAGTFAARATEKRSRPRTAPGRITNRGSPAFALGVRAATRDRSAAALIVGCAVAVAAVTASVVFSTSVIHLVHTPREFGWQYDIGAVVNAGYGPIDQKALAASLHRPEVEGFGTAAIAAGVSVNGTNLPSIAERAGIADLNGGTTVVSGRAPTGIDEVALGSQTAHELRVGIGDTVKVKTAYGEHSARVTGLVVLPAIGPLEADRTGLGTGVLLPAPLFVATLHDAQHLAGVTPAALADQLAAFVGIDLAPGVDPAAFAASLNRDVRKWDPSGFVIVIRARPVRPSTVVDVDDSRPVPILLAGVFGLAMLAGIAAGIGNGTRARRRELAIFRALGGTPRQVRMSVRWHAITVVAGALLIGLPVGTALGRFAFDRFATDIGVAPLPTIPALLLAAVALAVLAISVMAAAMPVRRVSGPSVAGTLGVDDAVPRV